MGLYFGTHDGNFIIMGLDMQEMCILRIVRRSKLAGDPGTGRDVG